MSYLKFNSKKGKNSSNFKWAWTHDYTRVKRKLTKNLIKLQLAKNRRENAFFGDDLRWDSSWSLCVSMRCMQLVWNLLWKFAFSVEPLTPISNVINFFRAWLFIVFGQGLLERNSKSNWYLFFYQTKCLLLGKNLSAKRPFICGNNCPLCEVSTFQRHHVTFIMMLFFR